MNDLPPANDELTGEAKLPDGSTRRILFQGRGDYPKFVTRARAPLENENMIGGSWKPLMGWVTDRPCHAARAAPFGPGPASGKPARGVDGESGGT